MSGVSNEGRKSLGAKDQKENNFPETGVKKGDLGKDKMADKGKRGREET